MEGRGEDRGLHVIGIGCVAAIAPVEVGISTHDTTDVVTVLTSRDVGEIFVTNISTQSNEGTSTDLPTPFREAPTRHENVCTLPTLGMCFGPKKRQHLVTTSSSKNSMFGPRETHHGCKWPSRKRRVVSACPHQEVSHPGPLCQHHSASVFPGHCSSTRNFL